MNLGQMVDALAGMTLFADLTKPQLEAVALTLEEESFPAGQRIQRQGFAGSGFHVILDGETVVRVNAEEKARLGKGEHFGETSLLLGIPAIADVVAETPVRTLHLAGPDLHDFLLTYPPVMYRMLQQVSRRLDRANRQD